MKASQREGGIGDRAIQECTPVPFLHYFGCNLSAWCGGDPKVHPCPGLPHSHGTPHRSFERVKDVDPPGGALCVSAYLREGQGVFEVMGSRAGESGRGKLRNPHLDDGEINLWFLQRKYLINGPTTLNEKMIPGGRIQMRLTEISIENFKGLFDVSTPLSQFVCLIGENNTGKSSILQALLLFIDGRKLSKDMYFDPGHYFSYT